MQIIINGKPEVLDEKTTLSELIDAKGFNPKVIVVEYNQEIAGKDEWEKIVLKQGDTLEIISFVGGG